MSIAITLRLLGFLTPQRGSVGEIADAKQICCNELGIPTTVRANEEAVLLRLRPILEVRGLDDLSRMLGVAAEDEGRDEKTCIVAGSIWPKEPTDRIFVEVCSVDLKGEVQDVLARSKTTEHGQFATSFRTSHPVLVSVHFRAGKELLHASAAALADGDLWVEWSAAGETVPPPGRFSIREALLRAALKPHDIGLEAVDESPEQPMLGALASLTGIPIERVRQHILATKLGHELGLPADVVSALMGPPVRPGEYRVPLDELDSSERVLRAGRRAVGSQKGAWDSDNLDSVRSRILAMGEVSIAEVLRIAIASGEISARVQAEVPSFVKKLAERTGAESPVDRVVGGRGVTWGTLLKASGLPAAHIEDLAAALSEGRGAEAWSGLQLQWGEDASSRIDGIRAALDVAALADYELRVVEPLQGLTPRAVARLATQELDNRLAKNIHDRKERDDIVDTIQRRSDQDYPGDALLRRHFSKLGESARSFLQDRGDAFDLVQSFVDGVLFPADKEGIRATATRERFAVREELLRLQRVARVARNGGIADALLEQGYDSAQRIAFTNVSQLVKDLESAGVKADDARRIHRRARAHYRATVEKYLRYNRSANGPATAVLPVPAEALAADESTSAIPTYEYLFGSQDYAVPEDWESVTSPGAYLVDLLVWLSKAPQKSDAAGPYETLVARRPDIVKVTLDRNNTETLVPHIDLVCELLEDTVAQRLRLGRNGDEVWQTRLTAEEIRAYPEHVNAEVYDALRSSTDAMPLPFDLPLQEVRAYLKLKDTDELTTTRPALVSLFGSSLFAKTEGGEWPTDEAKDVAAEIIRLSEKEFTIIANPDKAKQTEIWGASTINEVADLLRRAPAPSRPRDHITYDELLSLLGTGFIGIDARTRIRLRDGLMVDRGRADDRIFDPPLDTDVLDRLHRLLRLARKVPYSFYELDLLISGLGKGRLDGSFLCNLAAAMRILDRLDITTEEFAAFFRDFKAADVNPRPDGSASLYYRVFLQRSDADEIPKEYKEELENPDRTLRAETARISAALSILTEHFEPLLKATELHDKKEKVTFQNLSILYRHVRLARATSGPSRRSLTDFLDLIKLLGKPLESIEKLTGFLDEAARVDHAGLTMGDVRCLTGLKDPVTGLECPGLPDVTDLEKALGQLRQETETQLRNSGQPSDRAAVDAEIARSSSWIGPVAAWIGLDARLAPPLGALDPGVVAALLGDDKNEREKALYCIARLARLIVVLRVTPPEAEAFSRLPGFTKWLQGNPPTLQQLGALLDAVRFAREASTVQRFADYATKEPLPNSLDKWAKSLASACDVDELRVQAAWKALDDKDPPEKTRPLDVPFLQRVRLAVRLSAVLGVEPGIVKQWATNWPDFAQASDVRNAVRATLPRASWIARSTEVQNNLRLHKRDALVDYLLATPPASPDAPRTSAELSGRYLIDVEMGSVRDTSRIIQACAAVQVLVQRCLLGLERNILPDASSPETDSHWRQWAWRKRYRLWEANRRIFLYPENYLTISNRSDASPLFREFEKKIVETEIDDESVSAALENYLVGLEKISRLDYLAADSNDFRSTSGSSILGVVASSAGSPATYYYRRLLAGRWLPWEEISLGPSPGALTLAQGYPRAWVLWPTATDHIHPEQVTPEQKTMNMEESGGRKLMYVRYTWTLRDDRGSWSPLRTTSRALLMSGRPLRSLVLTARADAPSPRAVKVQLLSPDPKKTEDDWVYWTSMMDIARDATYSSIQPQRSNLGKPRPETWKADYAEYRLSTERNFVNEVHPWGGFYFDGNRMVVATSKNGKVDLKVPRYNKDGKVLETRLLSVNPPIWVTKARHPISFSANVDKPASDVFFICGGDLASNEPSALNWSLMLLSPQGQTALLASELRTRLEIPDDKYLVVPSYHPFANALLSAVREGGFRTIYKPGFQENPALLPNTVPMDYGATLGLSADTVVVLSGGKALPLPPKDPAENAPKPVLEALDFEAIAPYGLYNYETFFFAPLNVALRLSSSLRNKEAQAFFHFIFNPLTSEGGTSKTRFWVTKPFRESVEIKDIQTILIEAADPLKKSNPWSVVEEAPFDAHAVAASRPAAYQKYVVKCYLDNLIAWGDGLYRTGDREDIDEAIPIYQLAQTILGPRPNELPLLGTRKGPSVREAGRLAGGKQPLGRSGKLGARCGRGRR